MTRVGATSFSAGHWVRMCIVGLALSVGLAACTTTGGSSTANMSAEERQLAERNTRFGATVGQGAAIGAVVGGLAGLAIGGDAESALIGAAAGGALGAGAGYFVASEQQSFANREAALEAQIDQARELVAEYERDVQVSRQLVNAKRNEISRLRSQLAQGQISNEFYQAEIADIEGSIKTLQDNVDANFQNIQALESEIAQFQREGYNTGELQAELNHYRDLRRQQLAMLDELTAATAAA